MSTTNTTSYVARFAFGSDYVLQATYTSQRNPELQYTVTFIPTGEPDRAYAITLRHMPLRGQTVTVFRPENVRCLEGAVAWFDQHVVSIGMLDELPEWAAREEFGNTEATDWDTPL